MENKNIPEGFTLSLALMDSLPVCTFSVSMFIIAFKFKSILFILGALCCILAGCGKVLWKIMLAVRHQDIVWLNKPFKYLMSIGFILMLVSLIVQRKQISFALLVSKITSFPAILFFGLGLFGMMAMMMMAKRLDKQNARHNWIEQCTNLFAQMMILIGILLC